MQPQGFFSQHRKNLPIFKHPMAYRRRSTEDSGPLNLNTTPSGPVREQLPRRCKSVQPFYAIDLLDDEANLPSNNNNKGLGASTSSVENMNVQGRPQGRTLDIPNERQEDRREVIISTILCWLFEMKVVNENTVIRCFNETHMEEIGLGRITSNGIFCACCGEIFTVSDFPRHNGDYSADKPYQNMFIEGTRISLLTCLIEAWNRHSVPGRNGYHHVVKRPRVQDHHDDSCLICADGGDLMCCEKCPSTYHPRCMGFKRVPQDEWHCPYCHCRYCDLDSSHGVLLTCFQCLKKYHWRCSEVHDKMPSWLQPPNVPFCGNSCWHVYRMLEGMVGRKMPLARGLSWTLVRRMDIDSAGQHCDDLYLRATCNSKVAAAAKIMADSFKLIVDRQTRTNMIQSVVYSCGSNFTRTNFSRFYTAVLEYKGEIITVASLRIPSPELAEIPFIATAESKRNKGLCRVLLIALESVLADMGVERILIPSAEDMVMNWQQKFGFRPIDEAMKRQIMTLNTLMFPKTTRLQKVTRAPKRMLINDLNLPPAEAAV